MENLKSQGWILTESTLKSLEASGSSNYKRTLLDRDLREIGAGIGDLTKGKFESIDHDLAVVQVLKIRNISAPKANEFSKTAPKMLKVQLTDGVNSLSAIEMEPTDLSLETKPGTKIALKIKYMKMLNGQLLFTPKNIEILGGNVEALVSKWEVTKSLAGMKGSRSVTAGGPPPFTPFGQKIQQNIPNTEKGFKSLQPSKPKDSENDDSEFKAQRQDAIAEAAKAGTKKTFGGGAKNLVDSNVQKIMDKGFTEEQATTALKFSRNNFEKALSNLKRREENQKRAASNDYEPREYSKEKRGGRGANAEPTSAKPSGAVSLFDFLENKIPTQQNDTKDERFENNISSSFRKHDKDITNKSQYWSEQKSSQNTRNAGGYGSRDYRDQQPRENRNYRDSRDSKDYRDTRDSKDYRDSRESKDYRDSREPKDFRDSRDRDYRDNDSRREGRDFRDYRDSKPQHNNNNFQPRTGSSTTAPSNQYQKPTIPSNGMYNNNNNNSNNPRGKFPKPDFNNQAKPSFPPPSGGNGSNSNHPNNNMYKPRNSNPSQPSKYYNDQPANDYHKQSRNMTESMEKMNLKGKNPHQPHKMNATNYPPLTTSTSEPPPKSYQSNSNYPIVGFQNKEGNEHAKNALKTKNIPSQQVKPPPGNWQQPAPAPIPVTVIKSQPPPPFPNAPVIAQPAPQTVQHTMPQPFVQHQTHPAAVIHTSVIPTVIPANPQPQAAVFHQAINYPTPIIMQTVAPPPGMGPPQPVVPNTQNLKIGDLCLSKYWEDGQYYNAKITGVSDSTYVVLFMEYGNAEEVRKTDCVPLIPACPTPPHSTTYAPATSYRVPSQQQPKMQHHNYHQQTPHTYKGGPRRN